jgi:hypothetical protein
MSRRRFIWLVLGLVLLFMALAVALSGPLMWVALGCAVLVVVVLTVVLIPEPRRPKEPPPSHHYFEMYARGIERSEDPDHRRRSGRQPPR